MTSARNYDVILSVASASGFVPGNAVIGVTTKTTGFLSLTSNLKLHHQPCFTFVRLLTKCFQELGNKIE